MKYFLQFTVYYKSKFLRFRAQNKGVLGWLIISLLVVSCSQNSTKFANVTFHNTTAKYNAYYLAKEKLKEVQHKIRDNHNDDFNRVLDVLYKIDTTQAKGYLADLTYCREKCDVIVRKHKNSKWLDDAYILVGKTQMYEGKYNFSGQFFKYVNTKSPDPNAKHKALILLMRAYLESGEEFNAIAVSDFLSKKKLNHENLRDLSLVRAHFHLRYDEYKEALEDLEIALPYIKERDESSRAHYIAGQLRQITGDNEGAYKHYKTVLKKNPPYEFEFFAKLSMAQVNDAKRGADVKKIKKYFDKLLKDEKNAEYTDRIYYEKALYELKLDQRPLAITYLNRSLQENKDNKLQKAYSYLELGKIYYDQKEFLKSKLYYDSTVAALPTDFKYFEEIAERREVLTSFVKQYSTVQTQDSLRKVSKLPPEQQEKQIDEAVRKMKNLWEIEQARIKKNAEIAQVKKISGFRNPKSTFVFYNPNLLEKAKIEFQSKWGNISNEDFWRRKDKENNTNTNHSTNVNPDIKTDSLPLQDTTKPKFVVDKKPFYDAILTTPEQFQKSHEKSQEALYRLGKIYDLHLKEYENAIATFKQLIKEYPNNEHVPEAMYFLYLLCPNSPNCSANAYKDSILTNYRNSIYAELILDTNFLSKNEESIEQARNEYAQAFEYFRNGQYFATRKAIDQINKNYPHNDIKEKMAYLRAYTLAKTHGLKEFKIAIEQFLRDYRKSELTKKAEDDLAFCNTMLYQEATEIIPDSVQVIYLDDDFKEEHYYALKFNRKEVGYEPFLEKILSFNKTSFSNKKLVVSKIDLNSDEYIIKVSEFINQDSAKIYLKIIESDSSFLKDYKNFDTNRFIISKRNFNLLKNSSDLKGYLEFYRRKYRID